MSQLSPFMRFSRSVSDAMLTQAKEAEATGDKLKDLGREAAAMTEFETSVLLYRVAGAFAAVAIDLGQQIAADLSRIGRVEHIPSKQEAEAAQATPEQGSPQPGGDS